MSTLRTILWGAVQHGQLHVLEPKPRHVPRVRSMYLVDALAQTLRATNLSRQEMQRYVALEATLAQFVTSLRLGPDYVFLLTPPEESVWEIRCLDPDPSIRVFGFFADRYAFVATNLAPRPILGKFESPQWLWEKRKARAIWNRIFPALPPRAETDAKLLITGAVDGKYFK